MSGLRARLRGRPIGPLALAAFSLLAVFAVLWGFLVADPPIEFFVFDAGPVEQFAIGAVVVFDELDLYVVGLADGRLRAVDGRLRDSDCRVRWLPDDTRASGLNPNRAAGAFEDPCSGGVWAITGDAFSGTDAPLRAFGVTYALADDGVQHLYVELIGRPRPTAVAGD